MESGVPNVCWQVLFSFFLHWVRSGVLYQPRQCSFFGTIFPNLKFVFASICTARPVPMQSDQYRSCSTVKRRGGCRSVHPDGQQPKTALWLWVCEMTWYLYIEGVPGRMKTKQRWFKVTLPWMVSPCSAPCSWRPLHWRIRHSHLTSRQCHSLVLWLLPQRIRPQRISVYWRTPLWARGQFTKTFMPAWFEKWRYIKLWYMCQIKLSSLKLRYVSLIDNAQNMQNELSMGK